MVPPSIMDAVKRGSNSLQRLKEANVSAGETFSSGSFLFWQQASNGYVVFWQ